MLYFDGTVGEDGTLNSDEDLLEITDDVPDLPPEKQPKQPFSTGQFNYPYQKVIDQPAADRPSIAAPKASISTVELSEMNAMDGPDMDGFTAQLDASTGQLSPLLTPTNTLSCSKCEHIWLRRRQALPKKCPSCRSILWNKDQLYAQPIEAPNIDTIEAIDDSSIETIDMGNDDCDIYDLETMEVIGHERDGITTWYKDFTIEGVTYKRAGTQTDAAGNAIKADATENIVKTGVGEEK